jgi:hypothetical protein
MEDLMKLYKEFMGDIDVDVDLIIVEMIIRGRMIRSVCLKDLIDCVKFDKDGRDNHATCFELLVNGERAYATVKSENLEEFWNRRRRRIKRPFGKHTSHCFLGMEQSIEVLVTDCPKSFGYIGFDPAIVGAFNKSRRCEIVGLTECAIERKFVAGQPIYNVIRDLATEVIVREP